MKGVRWRKRLEFPRKNPVLKEAERKKLYQPESGQSVGVNPDTKPHLPHPNRCPQPAEDLPGPKAGRTDTGPQSPTFQKVLSLLKQSAPKNPPLQTQNL